MFMGPLFIINKNWKQPNCTSTGEWINKLWYLHTREYCSPIKRDELLILVTTWMTLEYVMLGKGNQTQNVTCYYESIHRTFCKSKNIGLEN